MSFKMKWVVLLGASAIAGSVEASSVERIVRIGHVAPLSGPAAAFGQDNENGARMAIDELNAKGVSIGGQRIQFWLLGEDDAGDPAQAIAAGQRLVAADVSGVVGHMNSGTSIAASKAYSDAGIVQISPSATNPKYTSQGFKTTFRLVVNDVQQGGVLGRYATQASKAKRIAVVDDRTPYGQGLADEFIKGVHGAHTGADIVAREYTYDAVMVMVEAMRQAGSTEPAQYLPALAHIQYQGITGAIAFDPRGDLRNGALTLYTFKEGKLAALQVTR